jgi:hypothetical protein
MRSASADEHGRIVNDEIGPLPRESRQLSSVIVTINAVLAPRLTTFDELEDAPTQWNSVWMSQMGRNLTDAGDGCLTGKRFLIHDRDPLFTVAFAETLAATGVQVVRLPPRSPNLNAYAERFVLWLLNSPFLLRALMLRSIPDSLGK